ncbi:MAG: hypothetical protein A2161_21665 [Candidatus Schekmanbacteria bacterium RBG_13_48_7]|uniref:ABC transporter domain-containing protein n=1 Tax=Candidatus Schekmanbacteria bacterium RBG_13_48_7 TaxID=1817878 RepID=A0A1F7RL46_9BACT|nr:MAG: hypothetical protein A2161_21665 [Candidatus Schekmanbacteria bacterium RBG_13_48_7]
MNVNSNIKDSISADLSRVLEICEMYGAYGVEWILTGITFTIYQGELIVIAGPNGCGKSSLVRGICNLLPVQNGSVLIKGRDFHLLGRKAFSRLVAVVPQLSVSQVQFTVAELVIMGRIPYVSRFKTYSKNDREITDRAIELVGLTHLRNRQIETLSGGERQRVNIAQALAQQPQLLILDEPTAYLDLNHQIEIMELLQKLREDYKMTILLTSHDLNLASMFCTRLLIMKNGQFVADGKPAHILSPKLLKDVYGVESIIVQHPDENIPHIVLRRKRLKQSSNNIDI